LKSFFGKGWDDSIQGGKMSRRRECLEKYWLLDVTACSVAITLLPP
jgi:hypothetical protein